MRFVIGILALIVLVYAKQGIYIDEFDVIIFGTSKIAFKFKDEKKERPSTKQRSNFK